MSEKKTEEKICRLLTSAFICTAAALMLAAILAQGGAPVSLLGICAGCGYSLVSVRTYEVLLKRLSGQGGETAMLVIWLVVKLALLVLLVLSLNKASGSFIWSALAGFLTILPAAGLSEYRERRKTANC